MTLEEDGRPALVLEIKDRTIAYLQSSALYYHLRVARCGSMRLWCMRKGITFEVSAADRVRLNAIVLAGSSPQKHVWRSKIILMSDEGLGTAAIMEATAKSKTCVWRWQERFMAEGVDRFLRDKSRPPGTAPLEVDLVDRVVALMKRPSRRPRTGPSCDGAAPLAQLQIE